MESQSQILHLAIPHFCKWLSRPKKSKRRDLILALGRTRSGNALNCTDYGRLGAGRGSECPALLRCTREGGCRLLCKAFHKGRHRPSPSSSSAKAFAAARGGSTASRGRCCSRSSWGIPATSSRPSSRPTELPNCQLDGIPHGRPRGAVTYQPEPGCILEVPSA